MFGALRALNEARTGKTNANVKATVILMRKNVLDISDFSAKLTEDVGELLGQHISFQLVSSTVTDPNNGYRGKVGKVTNLHGWLRKLPGLAAGETKFNMIFKWEDGFGAPGAIIVKNNHGTEFFLKTVTLENVPGQGRVHFVCNSWVYPYKLYNYNRVFFANDTYLPSNTPQALKPYRQDELLHLRGDNITGELQNHHRVYGYAYYNDLGSPDNGEKMVRPILGGSQEYPYPRRQRTGRAPTRTDPNSESRLGLLMSLSIYVPRDEQFGHIKTADFTGYAIKAVTQGLLPGLHGSVTGKQFRSFKEVLNLYYLGLPIPEIRGIGDLIPFELVKELVRTDSERLLRLPVPQVIKADQNAWRTDEEFAREMLAGVNPVLIQRLTEFPPTSKLDPIKYGNQTSSITKAHIDNNLEGLSVEVALQFGRLYILDHHENVMPYLNRINSLPEHGVYASRTILFLKEDGTLKPLAIELSLPHPGGEQLGTVSQVFTPATYGLEHSFWQLAKAYVVVTDTGIHQISSHWLNTHAVMEPFVIATHRQLSVIHPIHKLLIPHYRDTMSINAQARQILINADGSFEKTVFAGRYALELSAVIYKNWKFTEQGLPDDLLKRGIAIEDPSSPNKIRLLIEDYPYAVDGLAVWSAIESWVNEYCAIYYPNDVPVQADVELQAWWKEIREVGHGDKKNDTWWPKMQTVAELTKTCTTIIWVASALHAAINFGQFAYAGYLPNRPTLSRKFIPQPGSKEYELLDKNPDKVYLDIITAKFEGVLGMTLVEILSRHSSDELYLGQRDSPEWTSDRMALQASNRFQQKLVEIEKKILEMNKDPKLKNRNGPVQVPYTLLYPNTSDHTGTGGLSGKGIPNSISI